MQEGHLLFIPQRRREAMTVARDKIYLLEACKTEQDIDNALEQLGCATDESKCERLISYMGALVHALEHDELNYETLYAVTKEAFLRGNWRDLSE